MLVSSHWDAERVVWPSSFYFLCCRQQTGSRRGQVPRLCETDLTGSVPEVLVDSDKHVNRSLFSHPV